jgi:hypothetical protein
MENPPNSADCEEEKDCSCVHAVENQTIWWIQGYQVVQRQFTTKSNYPRTTEAETGDISQRSYYHVTS